MSMLINLLPDLRQAKFKERHRRQLATGLGLLVWAVCGGALLLMWIYSTGQKVVISNYTRSIQDKEKHLQGVADLVNALTADQHAASLDGLYAQRVYYSKFFVAYQEADPGAIALTSMQVDAQGLMTVLGTAPTYAEVAKLAQALAGSNITVGTGHAAGNDPYFSNVNITSVDNSAKVGVSFTITASLQSRVTAGASNGSN